VGVWGGGMAGFLQERGLHTWPIKGYCHANNLSHENGHISHDFMSGGYYGNEGSLGCDFVCVPINSRNMIEGRTDRLCWDYSNIAI